MHLWNAWTACFGETAYTAAPPGRNTFISAVRDDTAPIPQSWVLTVSDTSNLPHKESKMK